MNKVYVILTVLLLLSAIGVIIYLSTSDIDCSKCTGTDCSTCQTGAKYPCSGRGICNGTNCECIPFFSGNNCEVFDPTIFKFTIPGPTGKLATWQWVGTYVPSPKDGQIYNCGLDSCFDNKQHTLFEYASLYTGLGVKSFVYGGTNMFTASDSSYFFDPTYVPQVDATTPLNIFSNSMNQVFKRIS